MPQILNKNNLSLSIDGTNIDRGDIISIELDELLQEPVVQTTYGNPHHYLTSKGAYTFSINVAPVCEGFKLLLGIAEAYQGGKAEHKTISIFDGGITTFTYSQCLPSGFESSIGTGEDGLNYTFKFSALKRKVETV